LNLLRAEPDGRKIGFVFPEAWELPTWAQAVAERSQASEAELYSTFNMGQGLMLVLEAGASTELKKGFEALGLKRLGYVDAEPRVKLRNLELR
jgi:phosphoribosylaminoimidazole (AIR) synthetase